LDNGLRVTEKKLYRTEMDIWRSGTRTFRLPKVRHKMKGNNASNTNLEKLENKTLK